MCFRKLIVTPLLLMVALLTAAMAHSDNLNSTPTPSSTPSPAASVSCQQSVSSDLAINRSSVHFIASTGEPVDLTITQSHVEASLDSGSADKNNSPADGSTKEIDEWSLNESLFVNGQFMSSNNRAGNISTFVTSPALKARLKSDNIEALNEIPDALEEKYAEIFDCQSGDISEGSSPLSCSDAGSLGGDLCWGLGGVMALASGVTGLGVFVAGVFANRCSTVFANTAATCNKSCSCRCECENPPSPTPSPTS
jgi:hypothetical protein